MDNAIKILGFGSLLIESPTDENEEQFEQYVTELVFSIFGRLPKWFKFKIGRRFERNGKSYREFLCPAGSVDGRIQLRAKQAGGISRMIILRGRHSGAPFCFEIREGIETPFDCGELRQQ